MVCAPRLDDKSVAEAAILRYSIEGFKRRKGDSEAMIEEFRAHYDALTSRLSELRRFL
jgi:hypothetical protein